jgi:hypothetical protein
MDKAADAQDDSGHECAEESGGHKIAGKFNERIV